MSNYSSLKSAIDANIKANGRREITGPVLNAILNAVVNSLGDGYLFRGVAIPSTNPGTPDQNVAYLAITEGTYTHMGGLSVTDGELSVFSYNGAWSKIPLALVPTKTSQLDNDLRFVTSEEMGEILSLKQDTIQDLSEIRSGAALANNSDHRPYNSSSPDGMGYLVLKKNKTFAEQVTEENTIYEIRYDFDLGGASVSIPSGCVFRFNGGSIKNGVLSGELNTENGTIDAGDLGCVYGNPASATNNVNALKALEGVTNKVHLEISNTLYLGTGTISISGSLSINGNNHEVHVSGFGGFSVTGNLSCSHLLVIGDSIYASGSTSRIFTITGSGKSDVFISGCHFSGNVRVLHSDRVSDAELSNYINIIQIDNNTFEDIACQPSSLMVNLLDTNYRQLVFANNKIHNFLGVFTMCGITNGSEHETNITAFYAKFGRDTNIKDNVVSNDIDFKPWSRVAFYVEGAQYYTFALVEKGDCHYEGNYVKNIFSNYSGTAVYDAYLSANNLFYSRNRINNCFNLTGAYNQLLKSKGGDGDCIYTKNTFVIEDVDSYFPEFTISYRTLLKDTEGNFSQKFVLIEDNIFDVHTWGQATGNLIFCSRLIVSGNDFRAKYVDVPTANSMVSVLGGVINEVYFENNKVAFENYGQAFVSASRPMPNILANVVSGKTVHVSIKNNYLTNCILLYAVYADSFNFEGEVSGNVVNNTLDNIGSGTKLLIAPGKNDKLQFRDNIIFQKSDNTPLFNFCQYNVSKELKARMAFTGKSTLYLVQLGNPYIRKILYNTFGGFVKFIIEIYDYSTKVRTVSEINATIIESGTTYSLGDIKAYKDNGSIITISSAIWVYNMANFSGSIIYVHPTQGYISIASSRMPVNADMDISVKIEPVSNINKFNYHKKSGTTALRPAVLAPDDLGFEYFDSTLEKPVFAKTIDASTGAVTWVDSTGASV